MGILFYVGLLIVVGLVFGKFAKMLKLPNVTGYLVGGLLLGPSFLNLIDEETIMSLRVVSDVALGFIAFTIGYEFKLDYLKKVGKTPVVIAICEAVLAVVMVFLGLLAFKYIFKQEYSLAFIFVLSAIAAATAPAATIMVIRQYKARGKVTETLMSVVALDDLVAIMLFGSNVSIAKSLTQTSGDSNIFLSLLSPVIEIAGSFGVGAVFGLILAFATKWFTGRGNRISVVIAAILIVTGITTYFNLSNLLAIMVLGAVYCNLSPVSEDVNGLLYFITPPVYVLFFVLSGVELKLSVLASVGFIGAIYVIFRVIGKVFGASLGATIIKADSGVKKYLGWALVPQAGVAIGLSLLSETVVPEFSKEIRAIILAATLIYELVGPVITKISLQKAGDIKQN